MKTMSKMRKQGQWSSEINNILINFIKANGFEWTYKAFRDKDEAFNNRLLESLINIEYNEISSLKYINDINEIQTIVNHSIETIRFLLNKDPSTFEDEFIEKNCVNILNSFSDLKVYNSSAYLEFLKEIKKEFLNIPNKENVNPILFDLTTILVVESTRKGNIDFADGFFYNFGRLNDIKYSEEENKCFLIISFYLYYLYMYDNEIIAETKNEILKLINNNNIMESFFETSYKDSLLSIFEWLPTPLNDFLNRYEKIRKYINTKKYIVFNDDKTLDFEIAIYWYLTILINAKPKESFDKLITLNNFNPGLITFTYFENIVGIASSYLNDEKEKKNDNSKFERKTLFLNVEEFYKFNNSTFKEYIISDKRSVEFLDTINKIMIFILMEGSKNIKEQTRTKLIESILYRNIKTESGFDDELTISNKKLTFEPLPYITCKYFLFELTNQFSFMINSLLVEIFVNIRSYLNEEGYSKLINIDNPNSKDEFKQLVNSENIKFINEDLISYLDNINEDLRKEYADYKKIENANKLNDPLNIFYGPTIILEDGFSYNFDVKVLIEELKDDEINKTISKFEENGLYIYNQCKFNKEDFIEFVKEAFKKVRAVYNFEIKSKKGGIIFIEESSGNTKEV